MHKVNLALSPLLVVIDPESTMERAWQIMRARRIRHLPVCDGESVVGILSDRDAQRAMRVEMDNYWAFKVQETIFNPEFRVKDFMSWPIECIDEDSPLTDAVDKLITQKISSLLVTKNGRVSGIVTSEDLLRILLKVITKDMRTSGSLAEPIRLTLAALSNSGI